MTHSWALVQERERKGVCRLSVCGSALHGTQEWIQILLKSRRVAPAFSLSMSYPLSLEYMSLKSFFF